MSDNQNPYAERGIFFTPAEYEMFENVLEEVIQNAERFNRPDMRKLALDLKPRLKQAVHAGEGMSDKAKARYERLLVDSFNRGDLVQFSSYVSAMLQSTLRLAADPAQSCAEVMLLVLNQLAQAQGVQTTAEALLGPVERELDACLAKLEEGWKPSVAELLAYVREYVSYGKRNALTGGDPWPEVVAEPAPESPDPAVQELEAPPPESAPAGASEAVPS